MKSISLSKVKDGQDFKLSKRSKVTYKRIKKVKEGIVFTSNNSNKSFTRKGKLKIYEL